MCTIYVYTENQAILTILPLNGHRTNGTPNVVRKNNGTGRPIYLNAGDGAYGANFGDDTGEAPEALMGRKDMVISGFTIIYFIIAARVLLTVDQIYIMVSRHLMMQQSILLNK